MMPVVPATLTGCGGGGSSIGASVAGGVSTTPLTAPVLTGARPLPIVPLLSGDVDAQGVRQHKLRAQSGVSRIKSDANTPTWGYNGALLGPALKLRQGEAVNVTVTNALPEPTTVHWHGLIVPAEMDGGPHQSIPPGESWRAAFKVANAPSTCWYHPHTHGATGRQVIQGLGGLLVIEDSEVAMRLLPHSWGQDDIALVFQDRRFKAEGAIDYTLSNIDQEDGYKGDHLLVNGVFGALWQAPRQWVRLRLLNACNGRFLQIRLDNDAGFYQIANEGGLLAAPVVRNSVLLAPGERAEVLVDLSAVSATHVFALTAQAVGMLDSGGKAAPALFILADQPAQPEAVTALPVSLPATSTLTAPPTASVMRRDFSLEGGMSNGMGSAGMGFTINRRSFDIGRIDFSLTSGTTEIWTFTNTTMMAHPIHVHGVHMSLLRRNGSQPGLHEQGQRDTFVVDGNGSVEVVVEAPVVPSTSPLMLHCHILEHEDAGMMLQFITQ